MNKNNVNKWQDVISKPETNKSDKKTAFVKVSSETYSVPASQLTLTCGKTTLSIPVGTDVRWLSALLNELS